MWRVVKLELGSSYEYNGDLLLVYASPLPLSSLGAVLVTAGVFACLSMLPVCLLTLDLLI